MDTGREDAQAGRKDGEGVEMTTTDNEQGDELDDLLDHLVFKEGLGPNGSGGDIRYWKDSKDISAEAALLAWHDRHTKEAVEAAQQQAKDRVLELIGENIEFGDAMNPHFHQGYVRAQADIRREVRKLWS